MQSIYVTWYGHYYLVLLISISKAPTWSPYSPAWHHDLHHHHVVTWLSRQLLLVKLLLTHSDKVKQLHGVIRWHAGHTINQIQPYGSCCLTFSSTCKLWTYYKTWSSHTPTYITSCFGHSTSQHALQKEVRCPLLCCCKFYVAATGF